MKFYFIFLFLFVIENTISQEAEPIDKSPEKSYDYYKLKQNKNNKAAKICLFTGTGLIAVGGIVAIAGVANSESSATPIGAGMFVLGTFSTIASIPLFIIAGSNKRKSRLSLKAKTIYYGTKSSNFNYSLISLTIPLK